jgi:PAN domain
MGPLEVGINRLGRDKNEFGTPAGSAADCSRHCAEDDACLAMSFMSRSPPQDGICWLKTAVPVATSNPAMVSAVKVRKPALKDAPVQGQD